MYIVKNYKLDETLITDIEFIIDKCYKDCHKNYFPNFKFEYLCTYDNKLIKFNNIEFLNLTIADQSMNLYELNKKLRIS